jgi:hypothetical protein
MAFIVCPFVGCFSLDVLLLRWLFNGSPIVSMDFYWLACCQYGFLLVVLLLLWLFIGCPVVSLTFIGCPAVSMALYCSSFC